MKRCESKTLPTAAVAAALVAVAGPAAAAEPGEHVTSGFNRLDTNRDGFISREEASKIPDFSGPLEQGDHNRDGRLDAAEFLKAQSVYERERAGHFVQDYRHQFPGRSTWTR